MKKAILAVPLPVFAARPAQAMMICDPVATVARRLKEYSG
jgi:hypothetical protein